MSSEEDSGIPEDVPKEIPLEECDDPEPGETILLCADVERDFPESMDVFQSGTVSGDLLDVAERLSQSMMQRTKIFFLLSENSSDPHFVKDRSLRYVYVNPAMEKMLKRKKADILGLSDTTLYGPDGSSQLVDATMKALNGSTVRMKSLRRIGNEERLFLDTLIPWKDQWGNTTGVCGSHVDITGGGDMFDLESVTDQELASEAMKQTLEQALIVARTNSSVLLLGESGSGKDFLARYIHDHSDRAAAPFRSVNCAALPSELVESELFGHEKGAFTGAASNKRGHVELAHRGTLLLNEIGELPLPLQAKLLTFLDSRIFTRVGGEKEIKADVRLIAATNRVLEREIQAGNFREDLFYRLNVFSIRVPPLRQRKDDLPLLVKKLLPELAAHVGREPTPEIDSSAMAAILEYNWPGNVRELRNALERALIQTLDGSITRSQLGLPNAGNDEETHGDYVIELVADPPVSPREPSKPTDNYLEKPGLEELHALYTEYVVQKRWTRARLARHIGVDSSTLKKWLKQVGIEAGHAGRPRKKRTE